MKLKNKVLLTLLVVTSFFQKITAQTEFETWGNLTGIRTEQGLHDFNTSLVLVNEQGYKWVTRKEGQKTDFKRDNETNTFSYEMKNISWTQTLKPLTTNSIRVKIDFSAPKDTLIQGAYFRIKLPEDFTKDTSIKITNPESITAQAIRAAFDNASYKAPVKAVNMLTKERGIQVTAQEQTELIIITGKDSLNPEFELNFAIATGNLEAGKTYSNTFDIEVSGETDNSPVTLKLFPEQEGNPFDGIGGNFRLQNPKADPQVIDYALDNLRVAWSRVELPWKQWHPDPDKNPMIEAKKGNLHPKVKASLEMAKRLNERGIPVILAAWFAPNWAIIGERAEGVNLDGSRGNQLDQSKKEEIYNSITSYIQFLKEEYGVEAVLFSFNESDLGIDVRQAPEEHDQLIRELGSHFKNAGLNTKLLLGDTADATGWDFTNQASINPESLPFIGGVSFHSWRGWSQENLLKWLDIANRVKEPLFVGEGSIDAGAWRYPQIFEEPTYALEEMRIYLKIIKMAQPLSILQWQLTSDYSVLSGGGVYGNDDEEMHPTQRFYNLKQLGTTPKGLNVLPLVSDDPLITATALGSSENSQYALHLVNKSGDREITILGIPETISFFNIYTTNESSFFEKKKKIRPKDGKISFKLNGASFVSLFSNED
ncbi:hypothetical protein QO206_02415 [Leeuwenhoekiella aequorea]|uniref:hypothetical protein n=1 Tax=Leeuwenhoekiella TaxID=283735 RepID=UPI00048BF613|nr:hypothetical protein [Leeuwenhoekiella sp. MAR_2009_132]|tara:strand:- start:7687 stop:9645 length:1959 start_codon:yes stop_codon:yes gene_type:complete